MSWDHFKHLNVCDDAPATWPTRLLLKVSLCSLLYTQFWGQMDCFECANSTMHLHPSLCECTLCVQVFHIVWDWEHTLEDFRGFTFNLNSHQTKIFCSHYISMLYYISGMPVRATQLPGIVVGARSVCCSLDFSASELKAAAHCLATKGCMGV